MATLTALEAFPKNVILLFGGRAKKESFAPLSKKYPSPIKTIISYGESRGKLKDDLAENVPMKEADTLQDTLFIAQKLAVRGDIVLLSPGCASYDQFDNFEQRGELFKNLVHQL